MHCGLHTKSVQLILFRSTQCTRQCPPSQRRPALQILCRSMLSLHKSSNLMAMQHIVSAGQRDLELVWFCGFGTVYTSDHTDILCSWLLKGRGKPAEGTKGAALEAYQTSDLLATEVDENAGCQCAYCLQLQRCWISLSVHLMVEIGRLAIHKAGHDGRQRMEVGPLN